MKRRLSNWEVWKAEVRRLNYFPKNQTVLPCFSITEQMKEDTLGKVGNEMERIWKRIFQDYYQRNCSFIESNLNIKMHKKLILDCIKKAKSETGVEKTSVLSKHISDVLLNEYNYPVNERTLRNYINDLEKENFSISINIANELAKYLGYKDLKDYSKNVTNKKKKKSFNKYIIGGLIVVASYFGIDANMDKCMIWNEDHYEKIACEEENAKPINEDLLNSFKKINPSCEYHFFNENGEVQVWYGKNIKKELEFFNLLGIHPETGKTLKPITEHMINKYICMK